MIRNAITYVACALGGACLTALGADVQAQTRSSQRPVSPTVLASYLTRNDQLVLLVLWRGTPGWFWRAPGGTEGGSAESYNLSQFVGAGGLSFKIDYDLHTQTAMVVGHPISLTDVNVVLMDNVDSPAGPTLAETRRIDGRLEGTFRPDRTVISRDQDLYRFLQCDLLLPWSPEAAATLKQALVTSECDGMRTR